MSARPRPAAKQGDPRDPPADEPPASPAGRPKWPLVASAALSLAMAVAVAHELAALEWRGLVALMPTSPVFWLVFALYYLATPIGDFAIFRRLWGIGASGFAALAKKQVYNDLVLSYLGEGAFLAWAKRRAAQGEAVQRGAGLAALFGAIKDVAILSALAGNLVTVLLVAGAWAWVGPRVMEALTGAGEAALWSIALVLVLSLVPLVARRMVFFLPRRELAFAFAIHTVRVLVRAGLGALVWHLLLPAVPLAWWLWLAALRQVVSRLPLVANKDLIFAGLAVLVLEEGTPVADILALTAALLIAANVAVGAALLAAQAAGGWRDVRRGRKQQR